MSDEPIRLLDDPGTPDLLREDLEAERRASWDHDAVAGLAALRAAIQADGPPGGGGPGDKPPPHAGPPPNPPPANPPSAPLPGAGAPLAQGGIAAKGLILGLVAAGAVAGITIAVLRWSKPDPRPIDPAPPPVTAPAAPRPSSEDFAADPPGPEPRRDEIPKALPSNGPPAEGAVAKPRPTASVSARDQRNAEEIAHMIALREKAAGDPAAALRLADEGQQRFAGGLFSLEREFIAISSLAQLGRAGEAKQRGDRFLAAHPSGPYADRVRAAIGEAPAP